MARAGRQNRGIAVYRLTDGTVCWRVRLWRDGRPHKWSGFPTKTQAREFYEARKQEVRSGLPFPARSGRTTTLRAWIADYLASAIHKRTYRHERHFAIWWTDQLGRLALTAIMPAEIERARQTLTCSPARINRYTDWLRHVLNVAVKQDRLVKNPVLALARHQENEAPIHQYTTAQEAHLQRELGPEDAEKVRVAILTGLRRADQFLGRKEWIRWTDRLYVVPHTKTRRPRVVFLSEEAIMLLRRQVARHPDSPWLYPSKTKPDRPMSPDNWYGKVFRPACRRAGLPLELKWHTLRHTFGSRLAKAGASLQDIMAMGGWTSPKAALRYIHHHREDLQAWAEKLSGIAPLLSTKSAPKQKASVNQ